MDQMDTMHGSKGVGQHLPGYNNDQGDLIPRNMLIQTINKQNFDPYLRDRIE